MYVFDTNLAIIFVQHVSIDHRYMRREIKYLITNINVYLFIGFEMNVFSLYKKKTKWQSIGNIKISFVHDNK